MTSATDKQTRPAPVRLVKVFFWQVSGIFIGALLPFVAVAFVPFAGPGQEPSYESWLWFAAVVALATAAAGGVIGTVIGFMPPPE